MATIERLEILIQSTIPASFDETLSTNEALAKMLDKINEQTDIINDLLDRIEVLEGA